MTTSTAGDEIRALNPDGSARVTLESGIPVRLVPIHLRQFLTMLTIITHGAGPALANFKINPDDEPAVFATRLAVLTMMAMPDAQDEAVAFLQSMVEPVGLVRAKGGRLSKPDTDRNNALLQEVAELLDNPSLGDTVTLLEAIVADNAGDLQALGKRLAAMWRMATKMGQVPAAMTTTDSSTPSPDGTSSADSPDSSTSSPPSTTTTTIESLTPRFDESDSNWPRSPNGAS